VELQPRRRDRGEQLPETGTFTSANSSYSSGGTASNTLTIARVLLTVTANNTSMTNGAAVPALTYAITGFAGADTSSVVGGIATRNDNSEQFIACRNVSDYLLDEGADGGQLYVSPMSADPSPWFRRRTVSLTAQARCAGRRARAIR